MLKMNETFLVGSLYNCSNLANLSDSPLQKQTLFGCRILNLLQEMLHFKVTYMIPKESYDIEAEVKLYNNQSVDIFTRPMSLRTDIIELVHPLQYLFDWNFGFTIYRPEDFKGNHQFYAKPFSGPLWHCLYAMALFCSILFYFFKFWEVRLVAGLQWECSFGYELLMVTGAYCQHIPPIDAVLYSRRGAYFAFFMYSYLVYTFYTSNLLSYIVNDKDAGIDVNGILDSDLEGVIVKDVAWVIKNNINASRNGEISELLTKAFDMRTVTILEGLEALKQGKVALLSDYVTIEPFLHSVFESYEACSLMNVNVCSTLKKFFFVSLNFPYKEEFKVAFLRMTETGVIEKLNINYENSYTDCVPLPHVQVQFSQILVPLYLLLGTYVLCMMILVGEIVHYNRYRLWPYVE